MIYHDFLTNTGKGIHKWNHYFPIYQRHLSKYVNQSIVLWEIGVYRGGSLQMWKRFLGPFVTIIGIDINPACLEHADHQIHIKIGDQSDTRFLQSIIDEFGPPDIVIDDGSHQVQHQNKTFDFLYDKVSNNGLYLVEDLHTNYWTHYGGCFECPGTFVEKTKDLIDSLNARHIREPVSTDFAKNTYAMCFYDSVVVFEKLSWHPDGLKSVYMGK